MQGAYDWMEQGLVVDFGVCWRWEGNWDVDDQLLDGTAKMWQFGALMLDERGWQESEISVG
jgi:hypothetical protein